MSQRCFESVWILMVLAERCIKYQTPNEKKADRRLGFRWAWSFSRLKQMSCQLDSYTVNPVRFHTGIIPRVHPVNRWKLARLVSQQI